MGVGRDDSLSQREMASAYGVHRRSVQRHRAHLKEDSDEFFKDVRKSQITSRGRTVRLDDGSYEKITYKPDESEVPVWPIIDRPAPIRQKQAKTAPLNRQWKTAVIGADSQIGYRSIDGVFDPFHDEASIGLFNKLVEIENPDRVLLLGDLIDLPSQGKYAQEAAFSNTTQAAIETTYEWMVTLRENAPNAKIDFVEGNHDKRLQTFVEVNTKEAFGLRRAGWPDTWPVMALPYLLRLDELGIDYQDAYPNAHVWINDHIRAEHGTKADSKGSTGFHYLRETPHISRIIGHSHRQEIVYRTTWDRQGKIKSFVANPGMLCRMDGAVPSFNGSTHTDGTPASLVEDWQAGAIVLRYTDTDAHVQLVAFDDGKTLYNGQELVWNRK